MAPQPESGNALITLLEPLDLQLLDCHVIEVRAGEVLHRRGDPEVYAYFPTTAVLSLMSVMSTGATAEIALVGREGMVGLRGVLSASDNVTTCVVQVGGQCLRSTTAAFRRARAQSAVVRAALDRYTTMRLVYVAQAAACSRLHPLGARLARWLLGLHDRIDGDAFVLSQQRIADALGAHRPSVAAELQRLDGAGGIRYRSRTVAITDRGRLEGIACECHSALHRAYEELFRPLDEAEAEASAAPGTSSLEALRDIAARLLAISKAERDARERAESATQAKDTLLSIVSHELRTPLQAILGWCSLGRLPQPPPGVLDVIDRNARAQLRILDDLLDAARITSDTLQIRPERIEPATMIQAAFDTVVPAAAAKRVNLQLTVLNEWPSLIADGDRLRQVIVNILMNSITFTDAGGSVDAEVSADEERLALRIRDTGHGIPPDVLPYVFEPFRQGAEGVASGQGLGLGLAIARALVTLHGGTIELSSPGPSQGTLCTITLPRSGVNASTAAEITG